MLSRIITPDAFVFYSRSFSNTNGIILAGGPTWVFTVPTNIYKINVSANGGGAGGGGGFAGGGGGGGGGASEGVIDYPLDVVPGETFDITVGNFGAGGAIGANGSNGTITLFTRVNTNLISNTPPRLNAFKGGYGGRAGVALSGGNGGDSAPTTTGTGLATGGVGGNGAVNATVGQNSVTLNLTNSGGAGGGGGSPTSLGGRGGYSQFTSVAAGAGNAAGGGGGSSMMGNGGQGSASGVAGLDPTENDTLINFGGGGGGGGANAAGGNGSIGCVIVRYKRS